MSNKVAVIAKLTAQPGKRDEILAAFKLLTDAAAAEDGTELYVLHTDKGNDDVLWVYELYRDQDALDVHSKSPAMGEAIGAFGGLLGAPPELSMLTPTTGKGMSV